jgi:hypothetical protein
MSHGMEWFLALVAIVLLVGLLELKPAWGGLMLIAAVMALLARGIRGGSIAPSI